MVFVGCGGVGKKLGVFQLGGLECKVRRVREKLGPPVGLTFYIPHIVPHTAQLHPNLYLTSPNVCPTSQFTPHLPFTNPHIANDTPSIPVLHATRLRVITSLSTPRN